MRELGTIPRDELRDIIGRAAADAERSGLAPEDADRLRATAESITRVAFDTFYSGSAMCGCPAVVAGLVDSEGNDAPGVHGLGLSVFINAFDLTMTARHQPGLAVEVTD